MATYYINADSGNDTTGDGSSGNPWLTLNKALTASASTDTIQCQDATAAYTWASETFTDTRTILGNSADVSQVVFDAGGTADKTWETQAGGDLTVKYITFTGQTGSREIFNIDPGAGSTSDMTIEGCVIHNCTFGMNFSNYGGLFGGHANTSTCTMTIRGCIIYDVGAIASPYNRPMNFRGTSGGSFTTTFYNNTFDFDDTVNTFSRLYQSDSFGAGEHVLDLKNNIYYNRSAASLAFQQTNTGSAPTVTYTTNTAYAESPAAWTSVPSGTGNLTSDPLFVDKTNNDYNLRPTSPCLGVGTLV